MRAILVVAILLRLASPNLALSERPRSSYTTLAVEFVGDMDRPVFPVVISTSLEEGEWYRQNLFQEVIRPFDNVHVVPASVLSQITELPLLKRALESAKPADEGPKTAQNVRFSAGVGHDHVQIMVDAKTSTKILKDIARIVGKYPKLKSELQEIGDHVRP
jgi:hypothetical protein